MTVDGDGVINGVLWASISVFISSSHRMREPEHLGAFGLAHSKYAQPLFVYNLTFGTPQILQFGIVVLAAALNALLSVLGVVGLADMGESFSEFTVVLSILFLSGVKAFAGAGVVSGAGLASIRWFSSAAHIVC